MQNKRRIRRDRRILEIKAVFERNATSVSHYFSTDSPAIAATV